MRIIRNRENADGTRTVTVKLKPGESATINRAGLVLPVGTNIKLIPIDSDYHYRLGGQVEDIMAPEVLMEAKAVFWCSIEQKWLEA